LSALGSYENYLRNTEGFVNKDLLDIQTYTREDFLDFVDNVFDITNPIKYDKAKATENMRKKELHELTIANLSNQTANTMTGSTVTTNNTNTSSGGNTSQNRYQSDVCSAEEKALDRALVPDKDSFESLKSDVEFFTWFPIFKAEAIKQGFGDLLDSKYKPPPGQETIFEKRQKLFYSFLGHHLMTKKRQDIVSSHSEDFDAQAVWSKLIAYHTTSPKAAAMKQKFLDKITVARIDTNAKLEDEILLLKSLFRVHNSFTATPLTKEEENTHMNRFASQSKDIAMLHL